MMQLISSGNQHQDQRFLLIFETKNHVKNKNQTKNTIHLKVSKPNQIIKESWIESNLSTAKKKPQAKKNLTFKLSEGFNDGTNKSKNPQEFRHKEAIKENKDLKTKDILPHKKKILSKFVKSINISRFKDIYNQIGLENSDPVMTRLNSLQEKNLLRQKIEQIWSKITEINKKSEQQFETFRINENYKLKKNLLSKQSNFF